MSLFEQFETNVQKETVDGVEVKYGANADGSVPTFRVLRRGPSNQRYTKALERESAPYRRLLELGTLDAKIQERVMRRVFCSSVLLSWSYVQTKDEKDIPFTVENAIKLMEQLPDLYYDLVAQADKASSFRLESLEGDAKNS